MTCGCKHKKKQKRGSGRAHFLSGVTLHKGSGVSFKGSGFKKKREKNKRGGMSFSGGGVNFSGGGVNFDGGGLSWVRNKKVNGRRVIG